VKDLTKELDLKTIRVSASGEREDRGAAMIFSIILLMILYVSILIWGQAVMTSVIEEKTSRVVEVMGSGVSPTTLLAGKLLGVGGAGLTQFSSGRSRSSASRWPWRGLSRGPSPCPRSPR